MNDTQITPADYADIQGLVLSGYGHLKCTRFMFLQIGDPEGARRWIDEILPQVTTAERRPTNAPKPETALNLAFTHTGLVRLRLPPETLAQFPQEFQQGMAGGERPRVLGDTDESAPEHWDLGGPNNPEFHVVLMLYGANDDVILARYPALSTQYTGAGLREMFRQDTGRMSEKEPFGFRDGISQPFPAGAPGAPVPGEIPIAVGEFLLGYRNGYGTLPPGLSLSTGEIAPRDFGRNGTYLIFRKLAQDVHGFWQFLEDQSREADGTPDPARKEWLAAKIVGRWPGGAPLVLSPDADDPALHPAARSNDFRYMPTDADGLACPVGAHIRRANPRDSLLPGPARSQVIANRHRIIRRARHYEDRRPDTWDAKGIEHGLCFLALNADIQRQFEFIQQTWLNSPKFGGLYEDKDPLVGDNDGAGHLTIPDLPVRQRLCGLPRFVRVRGGGYFFLPGLAALRLLATGHGRSPLQTHPAIQTERNPMPLHQLWQDVLAEGHALQHDLTDLRERVDKRFETLLANPKLVRDLFGFLRAHDPIFTAPRLAAVALAADVREVLEQDAVFSVTEIYASKMEATTGDFVLGMSAGSAQYVRERGLMQECLHPDDLDFVDTFARDTAQALIAQAAQTGEIDVVSGLSRLVPARLVARIFGTPGPDEPTLMRWMRAIFRDIFLNLGNDPGMRADGVAAAGELNRYLDGLIASRKPHVAAHPENYDDFLSRLLKIQAGDPGGMGDATIRRILGGIIVGTVDTNSKAIAQAVDQLLDRPDVLEDARALSSDLAGFTPFVWEALRFNPQNPFLIRHCERDYTLAAGTPRARTIKAGSLVLAGTLSAMFDPAAVPEPDTFRTDRPAGAYMHFGDGPHACFGQHLAGRLIPRVVQALLSQPGLKRADGAAGQIRYDGAFPDGFQVRFEATP